MTGRASNNVRDSESELTAYFKGAGYAYEDPGARVYSYDGAESYLAKVMPTITSISANQGTSEGGQTITIDGTSLDGKEVLVYIEGIACSVQSISFS